MRNLKILICPGGTEIGLEINMALRQSRQIELFSAGTKVSNHAAFVFKKHFTVPNFQSKDWIPSLNHILGKYKIDYIFPAHDDVLTSLAKNQHVLCARLISSPIRTCEISRSKTKTYTILKNLVPIPAIYNDTKSIRKFPIFIKPDAAQGSKDAHSVHSFHELAYWKHKLKNFLMLEYLPGREFTVDCFSDREKGLLYCQPRERIRTRAGISMNTRLFNSSHLRHMAETISKTLVFHGAWFFQVKQTSSGEYKLLEIAPRIGGAMAYDRVRGVNLPLLSVYEQERVPISVHPLTLKIEMDRALINRYAITLRYKTVFTDLDDTLLCHGQINPQLISFIFQCLNQNKKIILLTKHKGQLKNVPFFHRIKSLFDEIIHIRPCDSKAAIVKKYPCPIFIDDSFSERQTVSKICQIPVFDNTMVEMLIDHRV